MKKISQITMALMLLFSFGAANAQSTTALDFNKSDCNGNPAHLFSDLDSGKAVILFYFMPNCGSCPPVATKVQAMANEINAAYPGTVKGYAFPFNNTTTCTYSKSWVFSNGLQFYAPMDSGATAVANYGGFGMPTVVLVGGSDHRVMFSTLSFTNSDTATMRDSILSLIGVTGIANMPANLNHLNIFPNPASDHITVSLDVKSQSSLVIDVVNILGQRVALIYQNKNANGTIKKDFNTETLANGIYNIRISTNGNTVNRRINVLH